MSNSSHLQSLKIALAGHPNCGKTALFNALTGGKAKVGNYPGVTVERKEGLAAVDPGVFLNILDLPGTYSLDARTLDEVVTQEVLLGNHPQEKRPSVLIAVADATNLERSLGFVIELKALGIPMVLALNMMDLARARGLELDLQVLSRELGVKIIPTVATQKEGIRELLKEVSALLAQATPESKEIQWSKPTAPEIRRRFAEVDRVLLLATRKEVRPTVWTERIDRLVMHPVLGSVILVLVFGLVFQAIFSWAQIPMDWIKAGIEYFGHWVGAFLGEGPLKSLLIDGIISGVGSVLVFLPQIVLLFTFILFLEDSGYLPRAAFLMDRLMGKVGLHGRAFIPLLSSFACAIPGIMATRTIENRRDRLATILVAPLMTCSARLPVYSLLIAAFIPNQVVWGGLHLQGLVMLALYLAGIVMALLMAVIFRLSVLRGPNPPLLMELPTYKWPSFQGIFIGLMDRAKLFVRRAGTVILSISVILWFLASYPKAPEGAPGPSISYSYAGRIGQAIEPLVRPIGFNWKIAVALIPGFAAREVMIGSLATVYSIESNEEARDGHEERVSELLSEKLAKDWSVATALSLLVWYVLACQCLSTLAVTRRETNSWRWPAFMLGYMTLLAYLGSYVTYHFSLKMGLG